MSNETIPLGKGLAVSNKVKHTLTIQPAIPPLSIYSRENENLCSLRDIHKKVRSALFIFGKTGDNSNVHQHGKGQIKLSYVHKMEYCPTTKGTGH